MNEAYDDQVKKFNYQEMAQRTSAPPTPELFGRILNPELMALLVHTCQEIAVKAIDLNKIKKHVFYGEPLPLEPAPNAIPEITQHLLVNEKRMKIIHGIIGIATEAGELLEALLGLLVDGEDFDQININEEGGDAFWYLAEMLTGAGYTFEQSQRTNIAKLAARYGEKFSEFAALNRDLNKERHVLESNENDHQDAQEN